MSCHQKASFEQDLCQSIVTTKINLSAIFSDKAIREAVITIARREAMGRSAERPPQEGNSCLRTSLSTLQRGFPPRRCRNELFPSREQRNMRTAEIALDEVCLVNVPPRTCLSSPSPSASRLPIYPAPIRSCKQPQKEESLLTLLFCVARLIQRLMRFTAPPYASSMRSTSHRMLRCMRRTRAP